MNNRKKWKFIFTCAAIVVVVLIAIALVLLNTYKKDVKPEEDDDIPTEPPKTDEIYATSFSLNLPETIHILVGTDVNLKTGYINVSPTSMIDKLTYEVTPKSTGVVNGIVFENNTISAKSLGRYTIIFKMPKSKSTNFSKSIDVLVYDNAINSHIYQINSILTIGEQTNLSQMFSIQAGKTYSVSTDSNTFYENENLIGTSVGESVVRFNFLENYVQYNYKFELTIKDIPEFAIVLNNVTNKIITLDLVENDTYQIDYSILNRDEEHVYQKDILATVSDETFVEVIRIAEPLIKIKAVKQGEVTLKISLVSDENIFIEIKVVVL